MRRAELSFALAAALVASGCSTLAEKPAAGECTPETAEEDCGPDQYCDSLIAGGTCIDASQVPPQRYLGFDIEEGRDAFRAELTGCDREADVDSTGTRGISFDRGVVTQSFVLEVRNRLLEEGEQPDFPDLLSARFQLSQPSRLARSPSPVTVEANHPVELADQTVGETLLQWPRYYPGNSLPEQMQPDGFVLWTILPEPPVMDAVAPAQRYQMIVPPLALDESRTCLTDGECCPPGASCVGACVRPPGQCRPVANPTFSYVFTYDGDCDRTLEGRVTVVTDPSGPAFAPVQNTAVRLRHEDTAGEPQLGVVALDDTPVADRPAQCETTADCIEDEQFCNLDTQQCELALAGRTAGNGSTDVDGLFAAQVYSYCEDLPNTDIDRAFELTVSPSSEVALPTVSFKTDVTFEPAPNEGQTPPDTRIDKDLCIPSMGTPRGFTVTPTGLPVDLIEGSDELRCCDISCLPADREEAAADAPSDGPSICDGSTASEQPNGQMTSPLQVTPELAMLWVGDDSPCLAPDIGVQGGTIGTLSRDLSCADGVCNVAGSIAAGTEDEPREYQLRIETPVGSLLQSVQTTVSVDPTTAPLLLPLPPRRIVRGYVTLPDDLCNEAEEEDRDCGSEGARIIAERLRMPTETTANTPEPYFHQINTYYDETEDRDGAYILPLDPGVWLLTALPQTGTAGGPAELRIVDLREEQVQDRVEDFRLDSGILVTLDVGSFDIRSAVVPLDTGSWGADFSALVHPARMDMPVPDRFVDLNDPSECLSSPGEGNPPGCQIRRLIPGSSLPLTQVGQVRFTAREVGIPELRVLCVDP